MLSRPALAARRARDFDHPWGSLRFLFDLSASAVPNHPGEFVTLRLLVAWRTMTGFTTSGGLATLDWRNEAESGSLALRLTPLLRQASTARSPQPPLSLLHGERAIHMFSTSQLKRSNKLS
jgi:hypothetical protein